MLAISIRQPWAWMILHAGKDIENRTWPTKVRGRVLIHAAKGMTKAEYDDAIRFAHGSVGLTQASDDQPGLYGCDFRTLDRGGIVGSVEIVDCVRQTDSQWFMGSHGFVLRNPEILPFTAWKGQLGFFEVPWPQQILAKRDTQITERPHG